ncbi:MAG: serine/threonine protein kinase [Candidatus Lokiarchaeota archaeon]|nr:serine/threonine protein kinase [Candidatus Lokiarchaeota archaeon]
MSQKAIKSFKQLDKDDFRILEAIEQGMRSHEHVPVKIISIISGFPEDEVIFRLDKLHQLELVIRWIGGYIGFELNSNGHDSLALNALVRANTIEAIGMPIGVGKESDVYEALTPEKRSVAIKFHRLGRISFRQTRRLRSYTAGRKHLSWLQESQIAARREYVALKRIHPVISSVPEPIGQNRHCVAMELIEGEELSNILEIEEPTAILTEIIEIVKTIFRSCEIIHADLSEFNILVTPELTPIIIDWPQWANNKHPNAEAMLKRDISNVLTFFKKRFEIYEDLIKVQNFIQHG